MERERQVAKYKTLDVHKHGVFDVYTLHLVLWKRDFFLQIQEKIRNAMLENTEPVIKNLVEETFCSMQFDERDRELVLDLRSSVGTEGSSVGATAQV